MPSGRERGNRPTMAKPLIVGGGIAAYKSLELVRLLKKSGHSVTPVMTGGGAHFVTAMTSARWPKARPQLAVGSEDEIEIGHIQLSRSADFVLVCRRPPLLAKMAAGLCDDLATTCSWRRQAGRRGTGD